MLDAVPRLWFDGRAAVEDARNSGSIYFSKARDVGDGYVPRTGGFHRSRIAEIGPMRPAIPGYPLRAPKLLHARTGPC